MGTKELDQYLVDSKAVSAIGEALEKFVDAKIERAAANRGKGAVHTARCDLKDAIMKALGHA